MNSDIETSIILCSQCGTKNRIPVDKLGAEATCGRCKVKLDTREASELAYILRCTECGTKNRVVSRKIQSDAKCGKCKSSLDTKAVNAPQPMMITDMNFESQVIKSPLPVLLYAWSPTCPSCSVAGPMVDAYAAETKGKVRVGKLNVISSPGIAGRFNILGVPFMLVFDNGQLKESTPAVADLAGLRMKMTRFL